MQHNTTAFIHLHTPEPDSPLHNSTNNPCSRLRKQGGLRVTVTAAGASLCKNKRAPSLMQRVLCCCDSDHRKSDSDHCKNEGYLDWDRLMEASSTFRCQLYACCVKLFLAGVQTVSQRSFAAWGEREERREWAEIIKTRPAPAHANDQQQQL